jgi:hypothetical protein
MNKILNLLKKYFKLLNFYIIKTFKSKKKILILYEPE